MVEAMVALVVLAVGMLGIAGLYVTTLRSGGGAIYRFQAVNLASDLADRIRANRTANVAYLGPAADNNCYGAGAVDWMLNVGGDILVHGAPEGGDWRAGIVDPLDRSVLLAGIGLADPWRAIATSSPAVATA